MLEDILFTIKVKEFTSTKIYTCSPEESIRNAAGIMNTNNVSGIIVTENDVPVGIITDRDFRKKVIPLDINPSTVPVKTIMSFPLITIKESDYAFEAIFRMSKNNIHRLVVTGDTGRVTGIITDTDIIKHHADTPLYVIRDLEYADNLDTLKKLNGKVEELVGYLIKSGTRTREVVKLISNINDSIITKAIDIIKAPFGSSLPGSFSFLVLGSEGRMEQTLKTDQDNAIVYEGLDKAGENVLEEFATKLIDALIFIGIPECPGGTTAKNVIWRRSIDDWKETLLKWLSVPTPENILNYSMFSDLRTLYGNPEYEKRMKDEIKTLAGENRLFLLYMVKNILRYTPSLGIFGGLPHEKSGDDMGKMDVKKVGIFPITEGIKVLALESGIMDGSTTDKMHMLAYQNVMSKDDLIEIESSYNFFVQMRLRNNLTEISRGKKPSNFIDPADLNSVELKRVKVGIKAARKLHRLLVERFQLNLIRVQ